MNRIVKYIFLLLLLAFSISAFAQVRVKGYFRKDGTYVKPHVRSNPDGNPYNNWSFPGNLNPYTGKIATGNPETYLRNYYNQGNSISTSRDIKGYHKTSRIFINPQYSSYTNDNTSYSRKTLKYDKTQDPNIAELKYELNKLRNKLGLKDTDNMTSNSELDFHKRYTREKRTLYEFSLDYLGYYPGKVDGIFESSTIRAIKEFQSDNFLSVDGKLGTKSVKVLLEKLKY